MDLSISLITPVDTPFLAVNLYRCSPFITDTYTDFHCGHGTITVNTQLFLIIGTICKFYACKELSNINMFYLCTVNEKCRIVPYMNRMWTLPYMGRIWTEYGHFHIWTGYGLVHIWREYGHFHTWINMDTSIYRQKMETSKCRARAHLHPFNKYIIRNFRLMTSNYFQFAF